MCAVEVVLPGGVTELIQVDKLLQLNVERARERDSSCRGEAGRTKHTSRRRFNRGPLIANRRQLSSGRGAATVFAVNFKGAPVCRSGRWMLRHGGEDKTSSHADVTMDFSR